MRRTRRTLRRLPRRARRVAELGNELHRLSAKAHQLANELADGEVDAETLQLQQVKLPGCNRHEK